MLVVAGMELANKTRRLANKPAPARLSSGTGGFFCASAMRWALVCCNMDLSSYDAAMRPSKSHKPN